MIVESELVCHNANNFGNIYSEYIREETSKSLQPSKVLEMRTRSFFSKTSDIHKFPDHHQKPA